MLSEGSHGHIRTSTGMTSRDIPAIPTPAPIQSLPDEILISIFRLSSQNTKPSSISQDTLLSVSHVCERWRYLALASGELWTSLSITFPINMQVLTRATAWVCRSSPYPLSITIDVRDPDWEFNEESHPVKWLEMQAIMGVVLPATERWQEIKVSADNWEPLHAFLHFTQKISVPLLRSIHLIRCNPYFAAPSQTFTPSSSRNFLPLLGARELNGLTSVQLEGVPVDWTSPALRGLTKLSLGYHPKDVVPNLIQFRDLLNSCPELESFNVAGWGPRINSDFSPSAEIQQFRGSINLPRLRSLEIGVMIPTYAVDLLSLLVIPSLESLTIDDITRYDPQTLTRPDLGPLFNFLAGQASSFHPLSISTRFLSSLTLMNLDPGALFFQQFLQGLHSLRVLHIRNCTATALSSLMPTSLGIPCRNLNQLTVEACDTGVLIDLVATRRAHSISHNMDVVFQEDVNLHRNPLSQETQARLRQLNIEILPFHLTDDRYWRSSEADDSEALVTAILEERWEVAGAVLQ